MSNLTHRHLLITIQERDTTCEYAELFTTKLTIALLSHSRQSLRRDHDREPARPTIGLHFCRVPVCEVVVGVKGAIRKVSEVLLCIWF